MHALILRPPRRPDALAFAVLAGCAAPLLPGEEVLGVDRDATFTYGEAGSHLGASVAATGDAWLAAAPGAGTTWRDGAEEDEPARWVGWWGARALRVTAEGEVFVDGVATWNVPDAVAWAAGSAVVAATRSGISLLDRDVDIPAEGVEAVAVGTERVLALVCSREGCVGSAWSLDGDPSGTFAEGGRGGAVGEWQGTAWVGAPDEAEPDGAGRACAEDGTCVEGLPGDHLGGAIGGGYTTGTFNKWIVPPRARIVPLGGGPVLVLETGAEIQPIELAGDDVLYVGSPYLPVHGEPSGAVVRVAP